MPRQTTIMKTTTMTTDYDCVCISPTINLRSELRKPFLGMLKTQ